MYRAARFAFLNFFSPENPRSWILRSWNSFTKHRTRNSPFNRVDYNCTLWTNVPIATNRDVNCRSISLLYFVKSTFQSVSAGSLQPYETAASNHRETLLQRKGLIKNYTVQLFCRTFIRTKTFARELIYVENADCNTDEEDWSWALFV